MFVNIKKWLQNLVKKQLFSWGGSIAIDYVKTIPYKDKYKLQEWLLLQLRDTAQPLTKLTEIKWDDWIVEHFIIAVDNSLIWSVAYDLFWETQGTSIEIVTKEEEPNPGLVKKIRERLSKLFGREVGAPDYVGDEQFEEEVGSVALILSLISALATFPQAVQNIGAIVNKIRQKRSQR
jgi:hypothetical protein